MHRISLAAALAAMIAVPAHAQDDQAAGQQAQPSQDEAQQQPQNDYLTASMIQNARIVSLEGDYDETVWEGEEPLQAMVADLTEIGSVEEIVLDQSGQVQGITTDVGGFLGIGQKSVMIPLNDLRLARSPDDDDEVTIITRLDSEALENTPPFEQAD